MASLKMQFRREYDAWLWMKRWCSDPSHRNWPNYGGRGIKVCPEWQNSFEIFLRDVGPKPKRSRRIWLGRLDVNGNYEPSNVAWVDQQRQITHRRFCHWIHCQGELMTIEEANRKLGLAKGVLRHRILHLGIAPERAATSESLQYRVIPERLTFNGLTMKIPEWARQQGIRPGTLRERLKSGWPLEKVLAPVDFRSQPKASTP